MSGPRLAAALRVGHPAMRVLFVSGNLPDRLPGLFPDGGWAFLPKPFDYEQLVAAIDRLLR
jgi:two-component system cell cycle sensor histidine kinase/response regulator CckA